MITYRVQIWDSTFSSLLTTITFPVVRNYSLKLNGTGAASFELPSSSVQAIKANFAKYNRVKILRWSEDEDDHVPVWSGFIESVQERGQSFSIGCVQMMGLFKKRYSGSDEDLTGDAGQAVFDLLDSINAASNTGIIKGTEDITQGINLTFNRKDVAGIFKSVAELVDAEFEIDPDTNAFNFLLAIGEDLTSEVIFIRDDLNAQATNVITADILEEGKDIFNFIIGKGKTSGGSAITAVEEDAASQALFGRLEKIKTFDEARNLSDLEDKTQAFLNEQKDEIVNIDFEPEGRRFPTNIAGDTVVRGYDFYDDYSVGDLITVKYRTDYTEISQTQRVVEIQIRVDEASNERIRVKTTDEDKKQIATIIARGIDEESEERIAQLELKTYS